MNLLISWRNLIIVMIIGASLTLLGFCGVKAVLSYLRDADIADNSIIPGGNETRITEDFTPPEDITPGETYTKKAAVTSPDTEGNVDCYVRVMLSFSEADMQAVTEIDYNTSDWTYDPDDGYWYCNDVLHPGETTPYLMTELSVLSADEIYAKTGAEAEEMLHPFDIYIYSESVQAAGSTSAAEAWDKAA